MTLIANEPSVSVVYFACKVIATALHSCIFHIDVAEVAFNRCVTTNEGKSFLGEEVHATNDTFEVQYNYEFLEDFKDKHSSDR